MRVWGELAIVLLLGVATYGIASYQPLPVSLFPLTNDAAGANVTWEGKTASVAFLTPVEYNATRDATLAGALVCSHHACGPLVWVRGTVSSARPMLLRTSARVLTIEDPHPAPPPQPPAPPPANGSPIAITTTSSPSGTSGPFGFGNIHTAIAEPFDAADAFGPAILAAAFRLAPLAMVGLAVTGAPLWRRVLSIPAVAAGAYFGFAAQAAGLGGILFSFGAIVVALASAIAVIVIFVARRRLSATGLAGLAAGIAFYSAASVAFAYLPLAGWGD